METERKTKAAHVFAAHPEQWYVEPTLVTRDLLRYERFVGPVWDPACGGGNICKAFDGPHPHCLGTDIVQRADGIWWKGCVDFLTLGDKRSLPFGFDNIVTNPPFFRAKGTEAFIRKALTLATGKVAVFVDIRFLAGGGRAEGLYAEHPPHRIWHTGARVSCPPGEYLAAGNKAQNGTADWCWLVWDMTVPIGRTETGWFRKAADAL